MEMKLHPRSLLTALLPAMFCGCCRLPDPSDRQPETRPAKAAFILRNSRIEEADLFAARTDTKPAALRLLRASLAACEKLENYRSRQLVVQRIGSRMAPDENIQLTLRRKPLAFHLKWLGPRDRGKQVIRAHGLHGERVVAYMGHWLPPFRPTFYLKEDAPLLRQQSRFDICTIGMEIAMRATLESVARDEQAGGADVQILAEGSVGDRSTTVVRFRQQTVSTNGAKTYFFHVDRKTKWPILTLGYGPHDRLLFYIRYDTLKPLAPLPDSYFQPRKHW